MTAPANAPGPNTVAEAPTGMEALNTAAMLVGVGEVAAVAFADDAAAGLITAGVTSSRGLSTKGGSFSSTTNKAGGTVVTSGGTITQAEVGTEVTTALYRGGDVRVLSGVHGLPDGTMIPEASFYADDVAKFGDIPGVTVHDVSTMSAEAITGAVESPGTTIGAFCNSGACLPSPK